MSNAPLFSAETYQQRRQQLASQLQGQGIALIMGNIDSPMNYLHNIYPFRQDSCFSYYFGLQAPDLVGVIDLDTGNSTMFGDDPNLDAVVWTGPLPVLATRSARAGITATATLSALCDVVNQAKAQGRSIHYLPPYRGETVITLADLLGTTPAAIKAGASVPLIKAVVAQREIKSADEISEMTAALEITAQVHELAMRLTKPGRFEYEIVGAMEGLLRSHDLQLAYPSIFSKRGEVLHNGSHLNQLQDGDWVVNDTGTNSRMNYASDITRTLPVSGQFTERQKALYNITLDAQLAAIAMMKPGVTNLAVHKHACQKLVEGLIPLGLFKGDPAEIVDSGAYALVFQCGLGHQIGMDVHDMENLGEAYVGYDEHNARSTLFGMRNLRMGKAYKTGMVMTVEPGLYFIPQQIDMWAAENRHAHLINYDTFQQYKDAGGVRIEDEVLITDTGCRVIGKPIPKTVDEVEALMGIG
ncbi:aminopeptidase P family protein [Leeia oryzae]|uniref:aminopeptidase P family protein n=1 Tax=Leeia oryzae TaxID=356662 RepID=UPI00036DA7AC|nr:aminopeptidase P family protein [Leeia oryzae]